MLYTADQVLEQRIEQVASRGAKCENRAVPRFEQFDAGALATVDLFVDARGVQAINAVSRFEARS
jgi:hypothetical protein